ncbi:MAG: 3-deoxy-D-manno-octulosonic acid transferase, partial [Bacteroidetes bacterium]
MRQLYTLGIRLYGLALWLAAAFRPKARMWVQGRQDWRENLQKALPTHTAPRFWFHCASLGEFEQGRNLIDLLRASYPQGQIVVSFFSPSGYEIRKTYPAADHVCYLPLDTPGNAADFVRILRPDVAFFVKYELWIHTLAALRKARVPTLLISARVGESSSFLRSPLRGLYKEAFAGFRAIFTQDEDSARRIRDFSGNEQVFVSYDTRYDRVTANREAFADIPEISAFVGGRTCMVAGSTWPADEALVLESFTHLIQEHDLCLIIAPHEIHPEAIRSMCRRFPDLSLLYSERAQASGRERILWIDNIG